MFIKLVPVLSIFAAITIIEANVGLAIYGETCNETIECKFEDGLNCSPSAKVCECKKTVLLNSGVDIMQWDAKRGKCVAKLDSYCVYKKPNENTNSGFDKVQMECVETAICDLKTEKCVCNDRYYKSHDRCVLAKSNGESCALDKSSCSRYENLVCESGICKCGNSTKHNVHGHKGASKLLYSMGRGKCIKRVGDKCVEGEIECTENARCTPDKGCRCDPDFVERHGICLHAKTFGERCIDSESLCSVSKGLTCQTHQCQCRNHNVMVFDSVKNKCVRKIGSECPSSIQCPQGSRCVKPLQECPKGGPCAQVCKCDPNFFEKEGVCKSKKTYGATCNPALKECAPSLTCADGKCKCSERTRYENQSGSCVVKLGAFCLFPVGSADTPLKCVQNATCDKGFCRCNQKYNETDEGGCVMDEQFECDLENSAYSDAHSECVGLATKSCTDENCVAGAECVDGQCVCFSNYYEDPITHLCHQKRIYNEKCNATYQCLHNKYFDMECRLGLCICKDSLKYSTVQKYEYTAFQEKSGQVFTVAGEFTGPRIFMCAPKVKYPCKGYCEDNAVCNIQIIPSNNTVEYTTCQCDKGYSFTSGICSATKSSSKH